MENILKRKNDNTDKYDIPSSILKPRTFRGENIIIEAVSEVARIKTHIQLRNNNIF